MDPDVGFRRSASSRSKVDFPQPEGPTRVRNCPEGMVSDKSRNTGDCWPNCTETPRRENAGASVGEDEAADRFTDSTRGSVPEICGIAVDGLIVVRNRRQANRRNMARIRVLQTNPPTSDAKAERNLNRKFTLSDIGKLDKN